MQSNPLRSFFSGFSFAVRGVGYALASQRNFRFEVMAGSWAIWLGCRFILSGSQWALLILTVGLVLSLELVNTALEAAVDLFCPRPHPLARAAKDAAAGGVLLAALASIGVGVSLFWDPERLSVLGKELLGKPLSQVLLAVILLLQGYFVFVHPLRGPRDCRADRKDVNKNYGD